MKASRHIGFKAGVRLLLALATLAAGQSVAVRAESTAPRAVAVRMVAAPAAELRAQATAVEATARPALLAPLSSLVVSAPRGNERPLYLQHRALLL